MKVNYFLKGLESNTFEDTFYSYNFLDFKREPLKVL